MTIKIFMKNKSLITKPVTWYIVLGIFAIPHLIDDFLFNIPAEFGMTNQLAQILSGIFILIFRFITYHFNLILERYFNTEFLNLLLLFLWKQLIRINKIIISIIFLLASHFNNRYAFQQIL